MNNVNKYLDDISFIRWISDPTEAKRMYWQKFIDQHPEEKENILRAREILLQFKTEEPDLSGKEKIRMFFSILKRIEDKEKWYKKYHLYKESLRYAAVALIFFSIGRLFFYNQKQDYSFFTPFYIEESIMPGDQAQLIRSNGEHLFLTTNHPFLKYSNSGSLILNDDTIKQVAVLSEEKQKMNQLIVPFGKVIEVLLSDSTKVFLNSGSRLAYPEQFSGKTREVLLSGEAYFDVKHDIDNPFVVKTKNLEIRDLGTRFDVSSYASEKKTEAILTEGKISIRKRTFGIFSGTIDLVPGQLASYDRETEKTTVKFIRNKSYMLWTQGLMTFQSMELDSVLKKLERYFNVHFSYDVQNIENIKISGKLGLDEGEKEVFKRIALSASVRIVKKGENLYVVTK